MGPKKPDKDVLNENYWRTVIEEAALDEENWSVKVVMIEAAGSDQDRIYLNKFEIFAAEEKRFVIKNICKTETIFMVNQLGGEKKVKDDNLRVFEEGQAYLKDKRDIPPDIQALIIKHLIIKMKAEYLFIKRQRLEVKQGMKQESNTMIDRVEVRGTVSVKPPVQEEPPPPAKGKGKKDEPDPASLLPEPAEGKKYNTLLRVRGEEWRDKVYVDDFPTDGPNLYVAVTGFVEPLLAGCLVKIGIPLTAIVQIRIDLDITKIPSTLFRATKRGQSQTEILTEKSLNFWEDLQLLRINKDSADDFKNTAFVVFSPPYWDSESLSGNPDKIYDELCFLMYDVQDLTRQHLNYLDNMDIINIPEDVEDQRYNNYYNQQIVDLPLECVTMYSVLDSLLQTVCKSQELDEQSSRTSLSAAMTMTQPRASFGDEEKIEKAETLIKDVFSALCKTEANKKTYRLTYGEEFETHKDPTVINYGDFAKYNTFHLGNINLDNIVGSSLYCMPINKLWQYQNRPHGELEAKINFHVNVLLSCFEREDVETAELSRLIHILSCRKLFNNRSSLKKRHLQTSTISDFKKIYLKRSVLAEPLPKCPSLLRSCSSTSPSFPSMTKSENVSDLTYDDDPESRRIKFLFDCPDISELVSAAEIANEKPLNHLIDDFEYFEDFSGISAYQIMLDAFNKFNCVDYKYCEVTDCFLLMFFNSHDKDGIAREEWRCHLSTPLCLQDFFDFVLEEHYDWIQNEERIYDENIVLKSQSECKDIVDPSALKSCVENNEVDVELLMEGSLKYQEISQMEEQSEEQEVDTKPTSSKKTTLSPSSTEAGSGRKAKSPVSSTPKHLRQSFMAPGGRSDSDIILIKKPFFGYNLGDRRVEVFGKDAAYFSRDGTRVTSMYTLIIPMNVEYIAMEIVPGNSFNEFWLHRALGETVSQEILDSCESFRIASKDQIMINIRKQTYEIPIPIITISSTENNWKRKESVIGKTESSVPQIFETKHYHSFFVTWPNGLITESVHENNSPKITHIKQYFACSMPNLDEDSRCISLNGEVVIFKTNGIIEVLKPDGTYIKISKYGKKLVVIEAPEEAVSETSSDKSKKGKGKEKPKEKPGKASAKSSKNTLSDDEKLDEEKAEYELIIEEFEIIETSGLRQMWYYENSIDIEKLLIRTATDYCLGEVFSRRMDGTNILLNKDGVQIVTFPNNTRIITQYIVEDDEIFPEWTDEEKECFDMIYSDIFEADALKSKASISQKSYIGTYSTSFASSTSRNMEAEEHYEREKERTDGYISVQVMFTIEHANYTTITIDKADDKISVDSPNGNTVVVDTDNIYDILLDSVTKAKFDGDNLHISYEACPECQSFTTCDIKVKSDYLSSVTKIHQNWMKMKDSFCNKIIVNEEGSITVTDEPCSETTIHGPEEGTVAEEAVPEVPEEKAADSKSESSVMSHGKCREIYLAKTVRFFVLRRELSCAELVHRSLFEQYKTDCRWQPWCSISHYDTFGDQRSLLSLLTPVHLTETEKWLMESKLANKPKYLTYKDLKTDLGKGFYHWMRPYKRFEPKPMKPGNVLPPRLPRAFVLRTLEQQWKETDREIFKGAKELSTAILKYRRIMESDCEKLLHVPIMDLRPEDERRIDDVIQALAHRIYEDLKIRLMDDVRSRVKADITTKPPPQPEEMSVEGELEEEGVDEMKALEEERESIVKQVEAAEEMSPNLRRYWRRRGEELKEEEFYKMNNRGQRILNMVLNHAQPKNDDNYEALAPAAAQTIIPQEQEHVVIEERCEEEKQSIDSFDTNSIADSQHNLSVSILDSDNEDLQSGPENTKRLHNNIVIEESSSDSDSDSDSSESSNSDSTTDDGFSSDDSVKDPNFQIPEKPDVSSDSDEEVSSRLPPARPHLSPQPGSSNVTDEKLVEPNRKKLKARRNYNSEQRLTDSIQLTSIHELPGSSSVDMQSPSVDVAYPSSVDTQPPSVDTKITEPPSVETIENCTEIKRKSRKRKAYPELWLKNISKSLKNSGKSYTSMAKSRKVYEAKKMGPACSEKCKLKCDAEFSKEQRKTIFDDYWESGHVEVQRQFIRSNMVEVIPKYRYKREGSQRKNFNNAYYFPRNGQKIRVCKTFFMNTLAISDTTIRTVVKKTLNSKLGFEQMDDNRGKHESHNKLKIDVTDAVKAHINSIPRIESHYCRAQSIREYIEGGTSVAALHRDYVEDCKSKGLQHVSYQIYYNIFMTDFNISFWQPKKDQCEDCTAFANAEDKSSLQEQYDLHLKEKCLARAEKEKDKESISDNLVVAVYDLQAVMPCPQGEVSSFYYISKVNLLNFTITELGTKNTKCFVWHEGEGARGVNEIGSCVFMYLESLNEKATVDFDVVFYSDNCCGQQKNKFMLAMYQYAVNLLPKLRSVTHKFLVKGHTQNEGDSVHSTIQRNITRALKSSPIFVPDQYITLIKTAKKKGTPYTVKELTHESFVDLKSLAVGNYSTDTNGTKVKWADIKIMRVVKENRNMFLFKTSYEQEDYRSVSTLTKRQTKSGSEIVVGDCIVRKLYAQKLKVPQAKTEGILKLIRKNVIPKYYESFYGNL